MKGWGCQEQGGSLGSCMSLLKAFNPTLLMALQGKPVFKQPYLKRGA